MSVFFKKMSFKTYLFSFMYLSVLTVCVRLCVGVCIGV